MNSKDLKTLFNVTGSNIIYRKSARSLHGMVYTGGGLPPSLKPLLYIRVLVHLWEGDTYSIKISGGKISKTGNYPQMTI
jgi:hypothetical protein